MTATASRSASSSNPSNPGHGGPFDENDTDRRARAARHRDRRHDVDHRGSRQAAGTGPGRRGPPDPRTTGGARRRAAGKPAGGRRQGLCLARNCAGPAQARRSCRGSRHAPFFRRPGRAPGFETGSESQPLRMGAARLPDRVRRGPARRGRPGGCPVGTRPVGAVTSSSSITEPYAGPSIGSLSRRMRPLPPARPDSRSTTKQRSSPKCPAT